MGYTNVVIKNTATFLVLSVLGAVVFYGWRLLLARELSPTDVGLFFAVFSFISLVTGLKEFGTTSATVKFIAQYRTQHRWTLLRETLVWFLLWQLALFGLATLAVVVFWNLLITEYFKDPRAASVIGWMLLLSFLAVFESFFTVAFQGFRAIREYAIVSFVRGIFVLIATYVFLRMGWGVDAPAAGYAIGVGVLVLFCAWWMRRIHGDLYRKLPRLRRATLERVLHFGVPITVGVVGTWIFSYVDTIALTLWQPLATVGLYSVAQPIANLLRYLPKAVSAIVFPVSVELHTLKDDRLADGVRKLQKYMMILLLPIGLGIVAFAHVIIQLLFPPEYEAATVVLQLLAISQVIGAIAIVNAYVLLGVGKSRWYAMVLMGGGVINVALDVLLVPTRGLIGIGIANIVAQAMMLALSSWRLHSYLSGTTPWRAWLKTGVAGACFFLAVNGIRMLITDVVLQVLLALLCGTLAYVAALFVMRVLRYNELRTLARQAFGGRVNEELVQRRL